ncbi:hypothetical protein Fot_09749 [Forsythia ovata]|uniref:Uncharacterized protein n=1 Tax=Forsythia ovata TaxID=205694 RepID=A0ABD1WEW4_9LAMI
MKLKTTENAISSLESKASDQSTQMRALQYKLENFKGSDEWKELYEESKQARGKELLLLIQDEYPNMSFNFLFEGNRDEATKDNSPRPLQTSEGVIIVTVETTPPTPLNSTPDPSIFLEPYRFVKKFVIAFGSSLL